MAHIKITKILVNLTLICIASQSLYAAAGSKLAANQATQGTVENIRETINVPHLGPLNFIFSIDLAKQAFSGTAALDAKLLNLGPFATVENVSATFSDTNGFEIDGDITILGVSATLSVTSITTSSAVFKAVLDEPLIIPMYEFKPIVFTEFDLTLAAGKQVTITSKMDVFGEQGEVSVTGSPGGKEILTATLNELHLSDLLPKTLETKFPQLTSSDADKVSMKNLKVTVDGFLSDPKAMTIDLAGTIDFSKSGMPGTSSGASNLTMQATLTETDGLSVRATMPSSPTIPGLGRIQNPSLMLAFNPNATDTSQQYGIGIHGETDFKIPILGTIDIDVNAWYKGGIFTFIAKSKQPITYKIITLNDVQVTASSTGTFTVTGGTTILGEDFNGTFTVAKTDGAYDVSFIAQLVLKKWQPFLKTGIPGIKDITLEEVTAQLDKTKKDTDFIISAQSTLLNTETKISVEFIESGGNKNMLLIGEILKENWKLSDSIPLLGKAPFNVFDQISFNNPTFIVSTADMNVPQFPDIPMVKKGFGFMAGLPADGPLKALSKLKGTSSGSKGTSFGTIYGSIGPSVEDLSLALSFSLPFDKWINKLVHDKNFVKHMDLAIVLAVEPPAPGTPIIGLRGDMVIQPPGSSDDLDFTVEMDLTATKLALSGTMQGTWEHPMKLPFTIANVAMEVDLINPPVIPWIEGFGEAGTLEVGGQKGTFAYKFALQGEEIVELGFNEFSIKSIVSMINLLGAKINLSAVPNFGMKNVEIYFAPRGGKIGQLTFQPGITGKGEINILSKSGIIDASLSKSGAILKGSIDPVTIGGILQITGTKSGTGPSVDIELTMSKQSATLDGIVNIFKMSGQATVDISTSGASFDVKGKIFDMFESELTGSLSGPITKPDVNFSATLKQDFMSAVMNAFLKYIDKLFDLTGNALGAAQDLVNRLQGPFNTAQNKVNSLQNQINSINGQIAAKRHELASF